MTDNVIDKKKNKNNNNKLVGLLIVIIVILLLVIAFLVGGDSSNSSSSSNLSTDSETIISNLQSESAAVKDSEKGEYKEQINLSKFDELYTQEGGKNLVLIARPTCSYCELVDPIIRKFIKDYNLTIYYLNTDDFSDEDTAQFLTYHDDWASGFGTPMLVMIGDSKILDIVNGATDTAHFKEFFKTYGFIKE